MQGWVDLSYVKADRLGIEPATFKSQVQRPTAAQPRNNWKAKLKWKYVYIKQNIKIQCAFNITHASTEAEVKFRPRNQGWGQKVKAEANVTKPRPQPRPKFWLRAEVKFRGSWWHTFRLIFQTPVAVFRTSSYSFLELFVESRKRFRPHVYLTLPFCTTPIEFQRDPPHQKTRIPRISCDVVCMMISLTILIEYRLMSDTDERTNARGHCIYRAILASRVKIHHTAFFRRGSAWPKHWKLSWFIW